MSSELVVTGNVTLRAHDPQTGLVVAESHAKNLIVARGITGLLNILVGTGTGAYVSHRFSHAEIGTGTTATTTDTRALDTPVYRIRIIGSNVYTRDNYVSIDTRFLGSTAAIHIQEAGLFLGNTQDADLGDGTLFAHALVELDNSVSRNDISLGWQVRFQAV